MTSKSLLFFLSLLVTVVCAQRRCRARGTCPPGLECLRRTNCVPPLYTYPTNLEDFRFISEIQGAGTVSSITGLNVTTVGVITAIDSRRSPPNFWIQDIYEDGDPRTSEGLYLVRVTFAETDPAPLIGDVISATGTVAEFTSSFRPGDLPITELTSVTATITTPGAAIIVDPVPLDLNRLRLSSFGDGSAYEQNASAPRTNLVDTNYICSRLRESAMCLYEAHEHMLVAITNARTVTPELRFGEIGVVSDSPQCQGRCLLDGVVRGRNFGPYIFTVEDDLVPTGERDFDVGQDLLDFNGILFYSFSQYKVYNTQPLQPSGATAVTEPIPCPARGTSPGTLRISSWNLLNRDPRDPESELQAIADNIANLQQCPDIIGLSEIGDNDGSSRSGEISADMTLQAIADATSTACGGVPYIFTDIAAEDSADGGLPGQNNRVAFLYRSDKVELVPGAQQGTATESVAFDPITEGLTLNPGRIDPSSFSDSRKPLAAEFRFINAPSLQSFIVIVNHWNSKTGDDSLFGRVQPPLQSSLEERTVQSAAVRSFISSVPRRKPLMAIGDFNDFHFANPVRSLGLRNLWFSVPQSDRYSFTFQSRRQTLDHILVSGRSVGCSRLCAVHSSTLSSEGSILRPTDRDALVAVCTLRA